LTAEAVIHSLNVHHHIALIPVTVDHLGGLGPFASTLLFSPQDSPSTPPPSTPITAYNLKNPSSIIAHDVALASSLFVASRATNEWKKTHPTTKFGQTYHTMTPAQWALQSLLLNISHALGKYFCSALTDLSHAKLCVPLRTRLNFYGPMPYLFRPHAPVLITAAPHVTRTFHAEPLS
jgi:hypothetical protein